MVLFARCRLLVFYEELLRQAGHQVRVKENHVWELSHSSPEAESVEVERSTLLDSRSVNQEGVVGESMILARSLVANVNTSLDRAEDKIALLEAELGLARAEIDNLVVDRADGKRQVAQTIAAAHAARREVERLATRVATQDAELEALRIGTTRIENESHEMRVTIGKDEEFEHN
eukprot:SAG31_NODE_4685_length_3032_cov_15.682237_1_plen_175_part_00